MWVCKACSEQIEDAFDACWNCGAAVDGTEDTAFIKETPLASPGAGGPDVEPFQFGIKHILLLTTIVAIVLSVGLSMLMNLLFGVALGILMLTLFGFAFWFLVWSLLYLAAGEFVFGSTRSRDVKRPLPFNVWRARNQVDPESESDNLE